MSDPFFIDGTFAAPRHYVSEHNPAYDKVKIYLTALNGPTRSDGLTAKDTV